MNPKPSTTLRPELWARAGIFSLAYFACASVGHLITWHPEHFVSFWLPGGLFVATLLLHETRHWPLFVLAALPANLGFDLWNGQLAHTSFLFYCGNSLEALLGAWLVRRFVAERPNLTTLREMGGLAFWSAAVSTTVGATRGAVAVTFLIRVGSYLDNWLMWWSGDALGVLLLAPAVFAWRTARWPAPRRPSAKQIEAAILLALLALGVAVIFNDRLHPNMSLKYLMIPAVAWTAFRFGLPGVTLASMLVALFAGWLTVNGYSDISRSGLPPREQVAALQLFLAVVTLCGLVSSALLSERRQAEAALHERGLQLRLFVEHSPAAIAMFDRDMRYLVVSRRWLSDYNLGSREIIGRSHYEVFPDLPERWKDIHRRCLGGAVEKCDEDPFPRADGTTDWVRWEIRPWEDAQGIGGIIIFSEVITPRKQAEAALRNSEERHRILFETMAQGVVYQDAEGRIISANPAAERILGLTFDQMRGKTSMDSQWKAVHEDGSDYPGDTHPVVVALKTGQEVRHEVMGVSRSGTNEYVWINVTAVPQFRPGETKPCQVYATFDDITERKRAQEELARTARDWQTTFDAANDAIWVLDRDQRVVRSNKMADQLFPHSCPVGGRHCWEILHGGNCPVPECPVQRARQSLHREGMELQINGRWYQITGDPILDADGRFDGAIHIVRDITEHRQAEQAREHLMIQNQLLQKSESLSRMAGAIAHNFNNQLQGVMMNLNLALNDLPAGAEATTSLLEAMKSARKAAEISSLMLTYLGQTHGQREPLDLAEACRQGLPMLQAAIPKTIVLETSLPAPGPVVSANATQIQQVLANLLTNACEACVEGRGEIRVAIHTVDAAAISATGRFPIGWQPHGPAYACLRVADTGCGIAAGDIEKLFDPFFSSKFTGRGLGLSVVLGIVQEHGGAITVESEPGRSSVFQVFLPLSPADVSHRPAPAASTSGTGPGGPGTVLVVEDETAVCNAVARALRRAGFAVHTAADGVEALDLFRRHPDEIGCVLCDLTMPRMDGWETLSALRKLAPGLPVILSSGYNEARAMEGHHSELPNVFLSKPYEFKGLIHTIRRILPDVVLNEGVRKML